MDIIANLQNYSNAELEILYKELETAYRAGNPLLSDHQYDHIFLPFIKDKLGATHPIFQQIGVEPLGLFNTNSKYTREEMFSIENFFTTEDILKFEKRFLNLREIHPNPQFQASSKLDGMSGFDDGKVLSTRGDKTTGENITKLLDFGVVIVGGQRGLGAGEIVIKTEYFYDNLYPTYTSPRNFVVGLARAIEPNELQAKALRDQAIVFYPYTELPKVYLENIQEFIEKRLEIEEQLIASCDYDADGVVLECITPEIIAALGTNTKYKKWQAAIKNNNESIITTVTDVELRTGRTGAVTPRVFFEEVSLSNAKITKATYHNIQYLIEAGLWIGSKIEVIRSGKVIPYIRKVLTRSDHCIAPTNCPTCGSVLETVDRKTFCFNSECSSRVFKKILNFFAEIPNSNGVGEQTLQKLFEAGFDSISKIFEVSLEDLASIGLGPKQAVNFSQALINILETPIKESEFLCALSIEGIGKSVAAKITQLYPLEQLTKLSELELLAVPSFAIKKSVVVAENIEENIDFIEDALSVGFEIIKDSETESGEIVENPQIAGRSFVFTGAMPYPREQLQAKVKLNGGITPASVSKNTDYLVIGEKIGKNKIEKARSIGVKVISYQEFEAMF